MLRFKERLKLLPLLLTLPLILNFTPEPDQEATPLIIGTPLEEIALLEQIAQQIEYQRELELERLIEKQEHLQDLGWYEGEVDGIKGPLTEAALEEFIDAAGIERVSQTTVLSALRDEDAPEAPPPPPPPTPETPSESTTNNTTPPSSEGRYGVGEPWATLAECESGNWINGGASFEAGSARWHWGGSDPIPPWGTSIHDGGLQFHPDTWRWIAGDMGLLSQYPRAYHAPPSVQVQVARELLKHQGWGAWPVCSRKIGLR